jgi:hypothetical protein
VGTTPLQIPRPKRGEEALTLVIKLEGHKERDVKVNAFTSQQLNVELEKERRRSGGGSAKPAEAAKPQPEEDKKPSKPNKPASPQTEVLDPWS